MAKSIATIMNQIERLQKEAAAIQSEIIGRIRKDIAKYGLSPEQLFGPPALSGKSARKPKAEAPKTAKYADGAGNTWAGMGKRPTWLRQALEAGKSLEDFLVAKSSDAKPSKRGASGKAGSPRTTRARAKRKVAAAAKSRAAKRTPARRTKAAASEAAA